MPGELLVGIQADDLTGACDTGAPFAARGLQTLVLLGDAALPSTLPDVLVLDTETRGGPA
ncbi:MAG: four-carbon acid sugar kinase family protein, partial [Candidatus Rokuibacteriota bacterium]